MPWTIGDRVTAAGTAMGNQNGVAFIALPAFLCHGVIGQVGRNTGGCTTTHPPVFRVPCSVLLRERGGLEGAKPPPFGALRRCSELCHRREPRSANGLCHSGEGVEGQRPRGSRAAPWQVFSEAKV